MNRRAFLNTSSFVAVGAILAACSTFQGSTPQGITQQVLTDAQSFANGLAAILPNLTGIPSTVMTILTNAAKDAADAASKLVVNMQQTVAQPLVQRVEGDVQTFVHDLATFNVGSSVQNILGDIQIVLPLLVSAVGMVIPAALAKAASPTAVTAARARLAALPKAKIS